VRSGQAVVLGQRHDVIPPGTGRNGRDPALHIDADRRVERIRTSKPSSMGAAEPAAEQGEWNGTALYRWNLLVGHKNSLLPSTEAESLG
jgi:hypothetical protein